MRDFELVQRVCKLCRLTNRTQNTVAQQ